MKTETLIQKLTKLNIQNKIVDLNGYNKDMYFKINGLQFVAGISYDGKVITDFCREICFDHANQEMQRRFFANFAALMRYANA